MSDFIPKVTLGFHKWILDPKDPVFDPAKNPHCEGCKIFLEQQCLCFKSSSKYPNLRGGKKGCNKCICTYILIQDLIRKQDGVPKNHFVCKVGCLTCLRPCKKGDFNLFCVHPICAAEDNITR